MSTCYQIDFLPVGDGERSGDAICMRYGSPGNFKVMVYDGCTKEAGTALVRHVRKHYGTNVIDYVVCSHLDADRACGLAVVLKEMRVLELWMHRPWTHAKLICQCVNDAGLTDEGVAKRLREKLTAACALEALAIKRGIPLYEPFQGSRIGEFAVLSPNRVWYLGQLIAHFEKASAKKRSAATDAGGLSWKSMFEPVRQAVSWAAESWGIETLREDVGTSTKNESSVVLFGLPGGRGVLFTGDAGVQALSAAAEYAEEKGVSIPQYIKFVQIPHHGNDNNVSPSVLDRLIGPKTIIPLTNRRITAFVSVAKESGTHPRKAVVNAFLRRGARVIATKGVTKSHFYNMNQKAEWGATESRSLPLMQQTDDPERENE